jgi:hypothetical protein
MSHAGRVFTFIQLPRGGLTAGLLALLLPLGARAADPEGALRPAAALAVLLVLYLLARSTLVLRADPSGFIFRRLPEVLGFSSLDARGPGIRWSEVRRFRTVVDRAIEWGPLAWATGALMLETPAGEIRLPLHPKLLLRLPLLVEPAGRWGGATPGRPPLLGLEPATRARVLRDDVFFRASLRLEDLAQRTLREGESSGAPDRAVALLRRGYGSILHLRLRRAAACFLEALTFFPEDAALRVDAIDVLARLGRLDQALAQQQWLIRSDPLDPHAWTRLGNLLEASGDGERAVRAWRRAGECGDPTGEAGVALGHHLLRRGEREQALAVLRETLVRLPFPAERESLALWLERLEGEGDPLVGPEASFRLERFAAVGRGVGVGLIYLFLAGYVMAGGTTAVWGGMGAGLTLFLVTTLLSRVGPEV